MGSTWILCGFKGSVSTLNACLDANGQDLIYGTPRFHAHHPDKDTISRLLFSKISAINPTADKNRFRVLIPGLRGYPRSPVAYVTHAWAPVQAHLEVDLEKDLPDEVSCGFEELRRDILSFSNGDERDHGKMGVHVDVVMTYGIRGEYYTELQHRDSVELLLRGNW